MVGYSHLITFDGVNLRFQGRCKYALLVGEPRAGLDLPPVSVYGRYRSLFGSRYVSYLQYVEVQLYGRSVRIEQGAETLVSGQVVLVAYRRRGGETELLLPRLTVGWEEYIRYILKNACTGH